jgi:hypothetical protein
VTEAFALIFVVVVIGFWLSGLRARDTAVEAARLACAAEGVQLLDDTVALAAMRPQRTADGRVALRRIYRFEFSDNGDNRLTGSVTVLGSRVLALYLEPHSGHE